MRGVCLVAYAIFVLIAMADYLRVTPRPDAMGGWVVDVFFALTALRGAAIAKWVR